MEISTFPPVAEAKGRVLGRTEPVDAARVLAGLSALQWRGPSELSYAAGIVRGLASKHLCVACGGGPLVDPTSRRRNVGEDCWVAGYRLPAWLDLAEMLG